MNESVKQAVDNAIQYLQDVYQSQNVPIDTILLEEIERSEDDRHWLITLGFNTPAVKPRNTFSNALGVPSAERQYKLFRVRASTGEVEAMKIRSFE